MSGVSRSQIVADLSISVEEDYRHLLYVGKVKETQVPKFIAADTVSLLAVG